MKNIDQNIDKDNARLEVLKTKYSPYLNFVNNEDEKLYKFSSFDAIYACPYLPHETQNLDINRNVITGLYPCNTRESTLLSSVYFFEFGDFHEKEYETIKNNLYKFAKFHDCYEELKNIEEIFLKEAEIKEAWGPHCKDPRFRNWKKKKKDNKKKASFEIGNSDDVEDFVNYLKENRKEFKFENLKEVCKNVLDICKNENIFIDSDNTNFLMKKAGMGKYDSDEVVAYLNDLKWTIDKNFLTDYKKVKKTIMEGVDVLINKFKNEDLDEGQLVKYASFVEDIINTLNLNFDYPEDVFFNYTYKMLKEAKDNFVYNDAVDVAYDKQELRKLDPYLLKQHMGDDFFDNVKIRENKISIEKLASYLEHSPKEVKLKFHEFLTLNKIKS